MKVRANARNLAVDTNKLADYYLQHRGDTLRLRCEQCSRNLGIVTEEMTAGEAREVIAHAAAHDLACVRLPGFE